jgi:4-alpha-glucanotransferase
MPWPLIRASLRSVARLAVVPLQDLLGLDSDQRMNTPGTTKGNWEWRLRPGQIDSLDSERIAHILRLYDRR